MNHLTRLYLLLLAVSFSSCSTDQAKANEDVGTNQWTPSYKVSGPCSRSCDLDTNTTLDVIRHYTYNASGDLQDSTTEVMNPESMSSQNHPGCNHQTAIFRTLEILDTSYLGELHRGYTRTIERYNDQGQVKTIRTVYEDSIEVSGRYNPMKATTFRQNYEYDTKGMITLVESQLNVSGTNSEWITYDTQNGIYDSLSRLIYWGDDSPGAEHIHYTWKYDSSGTLLSYSISDSDAEYGIRIDYVYDDYGNLLQEFHHYESSLREQSSYYGYDYLCWDD